MTSDELALVDFQFFIEQKLKLNLWKCQKVWAEKVQACIDGDWEGLLLLAPPDHGKTSRIVIPLILWMLARNKATRIILLGNLDDYAQQIGRAVMTRIERMPVLDKSYGLQRGIKWAQNEMHIDRPNWEEKDASLLCLGVGADLQSQRGDFLIGDDMATRRNSRTESMKEALRTYWFTDADSRLDVKIGTGLGKKLVFGHRSAEGDLYTLMADMPNWLYHTDRAIVNDTEKIVLAPEHHTYERLALKRAKDPVGFELVYQQRSAGTGTFVTRTAMETCRKPELRFLQSLKGGDREVFKHTWLTLDPAFTQTRWSSYAVLMLWGLTFTGKKRLLWGLRDKMTPESLVRLMEMKFRLYMPDHFLIESNQAQVLLISTMKRLFPEHGSKFRDVATVNKDGSLERELGLMFEQFNGPNPIIELPFFGPTEQAFVHTMTDEYISYPTGTTKDILMAQYVGEKGLGMLVEEKRSGYVLPRGIMGAAAASYRRRFHQPWGEPNA